MMFKKFLLLIIILINFNSNANENKILIKVDDQIITSYDILSEITYIEMFNKNYNKLTTEQKIEVAKNSLVREKIREIELKKFIKKIELEKNELEKVLLSTFNEFGISSIENLNDYFYLKKINPDTIRKKISVEILWNELIFAKYNNKIRINKDLIEKEVSQNNSQIQYFLYEILFNLNNNEKFDEKLNKIKNEINEKGFSEAALKFSISDTSKNGGKLGWIKNSVLSDDIRNQINVLDIGDFTSPITIPGGYLILKLEEKKIIKNDLNLEDEVNFVIKKKTKQQLNQFSNIYFNKIKQDIKINEL